MSPRASINCQAGLSSSRQEQMNQTLNGKIKPLKVLKTTQFQGAPLCRPRSPSRAGTRRDFRPNWDFFGGPPHHISWLPASLKGSFTPPPAVSDVRLARKIPSVFNLDPHFHPLSLSPPRAPPLPAPSAGVCARQASVTLFFSSSFLFFLLKMYVASFAPRSPPSPRHMLQRSPLCRGLPRTSLCSAPLRPLARRIPK